MVSSQRLAARQGSLFGVLDPEFDATFSDVRRIELDERSWVDLARGWLHGADVVFDQLLDVVPLRQRTNVQMYERLVDEPRMSAWWHVDGGQPEPLAILSEMR